MLGCTKFKYRIPQFHFSCKYDMILSLFERLVAVLYVRTNRRLRDGLSYYVELVEQFVFAAPIEDNFAARLDRR